jgi:hypothetical protein
MRVSSVVENSVESIPSTTVLPISRSRLWKTDVTRSCGPVDLPSTEYVCTWVLHRMVYMYVHSSCWGAGSLLLRAAHQPRWRHRRP